MMMGERMKKAAFVPSRTCPPHEVSTHSHRPIHIMVYIGTWRRKRGVMGLMLRLLPLGLPSHLGERRGTLGADTDQQQSPGKWGVDHSLHKEPSQDKQALRTLSNPVPPQTEHAEWTKYIYIGISLSYAKY